MGNVGLRGLMLIVLVGWPYLRAIELCNLVLKLYYDFLHLHICPLPVFCIHVYFLDEGGDLVFKIDLADFLDDPLQLLHNASSGRLVAEDFDAFDGRSAAVGRGVDVFIVLHLFLIIR
jgi:hypothetical protein